MFQKLPRMSQDSQELVGAAAGFVFHGEESDLLHPTLERIAYFPDRTIMPVSELPAPERCGMVSLAITHSLLRMTLDSYESYEIRGEHPSKVLKPNAYIELLKAGKKTKKVADSYGPISDLEREKGDAVNPHVVAGVVYDRFSNFGDPEMTKNAFRRLKRAEPMLESGETEEDRSAERRFRRDVRANHWRYGRTLGLAAFSGLMMFNAHRTSQIAKVNNPPKIAALEAERQQASPERAEEITNKEILPLQAQISGGADFWGVVGVVALGRFGIHYMTRPRREENDSRNNPQRV